MSSNQQDNADIGQILKANYREIIFKYLSFWKLFVFFIALSFIVAFLYLRYSIPLYEGNITVLIKNIQKGGTGISETSAFNDLSILNEFNAIENEKAIFSSRDLMRKVVLNLGLQNEYYSLGSVTGFMKRELYKESQLKIEMLGEDSLKYLHSDNLILNVLNKKQFQVEDNEGNVKYRADFGKVVKANKQISYRFSVNKLDATSLIGRKFEINILPVESAISKYLGRLKVEQIGNSSAILKISLQYQSKEKAIDILNLLFSNYNQDAVEDKNYVAKNTSDFITDRVQLISEELGDVEKQSQKYKENNKFVQLEDETKSDIASSSSIRNEIIDAETQLQLSKMMLDHLRANNQPDDLIPVNLGLSDNSIDRIITTHNELVLDRYEELKTSTNKAPKVINLSTKISELKENIQESIRNIISSKNRILKELNSEEVRIESELSKMPKFEKEFRSIERQQQIKESLYLYLLQKREEAQIALAVGSGNAKLVDKAFSSGAIVSPKKSLVYSVSLIISIIITIIIIYLNDLFHDKVYSKSDIEKFNLPYLGNIPLGEKNKNIVISKGSKTAISESFRTTRTNVDFMLGNLVADRGKFIFITSTVAKEGKSFTSVNFALSLALTGKKVLLLGMDLRAPKLEQYIDKEKSKGITNFIINIDSTVDDFIYQTELNENLYLFPSGDIPPNPSELLLSDRVKELFEIVSKEYEYIIVDTAPVGIVTDTLLISHYADVNIYVVRANQLPRKMLNIASDLYQDKRLPNLGILLNGTFGSKGYGYGYGYNYGYGYGYGYYQDDIKEPWWKFKWLFNKR
ncbi:MAG: polysaccharide biosynthesis tyrosine autokinase [Crocinitomicaceae bacterium]|nr:polysaccharide biosynthesis tyrosine autokinase [Crocinitomicaceae bacterium]